MQRSRDWRRAQTEKKIAKRLDIVRNVWQYGYKYMDSDGYEEHYAKRAHRLSKWNLNCGCDLCQIPHGKRPKTVPLDKELEGWYDASEGLTDNGSDFDHIHVDESSDDFLREIGLID